LRNMVTYVLTMIILVSIYSNIALPNQTNWFLEEVSFISSTGGPVYPGSSGALLKLYLRFIGTRALYPNVCIEPEYPFNTRTYCSPLLNSSGEPVDSVETGMLLNAEFILNIDRNATPGTYSLPVIITYYTENGLVEERLNVNLSIHSYPQPLISVVETYFTPHGYPGSYPVNLVVKMRNDGNVSIDSLDIHAVFQENIRPESARSSITYRVEPGQIFNVIINNLAIDPDSQPGNYSLLLNIDGSFRTSDGVLYNYSIQISTFYTIDYPPDVNLRILNYKFTANVVLPGLHNTGISLFVQSIEPGIVNLYAINVTLINSCFINGSTRDLIPYNAVLYYGDAVEIVIRGINIGEESFVEANVTLLVMIDRDGTTYFSKFDSKLFLQVSLRGLNITIVSIDWFNTKALPGSTGLQLTVVIANDEAVVLRDVVAKLNLSNVFNPDYLMIYGVQIEPYSLAELTYTGISVRYDAEPGFYSVELVLTFYLANSDGSTRAMTMFFNNIGVNVYSLENYENFIPKVIVESIYWGEYTPTHIYPGNPRAPLTVLLRNSGIYSVQNIHVNLISLNPDIEVLNPVVECSNMLSPSSSCQSVFYLNLAKANSGLKSFTINVSYISSSIGSQRTLYVIHNTTIVLPEPAMDTGVKLYSYGWINNNPAYPNSKGAVLSLVFANNELYSIQGIWINITLPESFKVSGDSGPLTYVAGPIPSFQIFTINYLIDIGSVKPGSYNAFVNVEYMIQTYGYVRTIKKSYLFKISVNNPSLAIAVLRHGWYGSTPINGTRGYNYILIIRNREFPSISKPMVKLDLPPGFYDPLTGFNTIYSYPIALIPSIQISESMLTQIPIPQLQQILPRLASDQESMGKGDYAVFTMNIGFNPLNETKVYANLSIIFIDHWGYEYSINNTIEIRIVTQPPYLYVEPQSPLVYFVNGTSYLDLGLTNPGDGDVYEVYIMLIPVTGNAIPQSNVRFIDRVPSRETVSIRFTLIYNPITISGFGEAYSGSIAFTVSIMYRDQLGYMRMLNQTIAIVPKPFIEVSVSQDTTAKLLGNKLIVNGIVVNTGLSKARSVIVTVEYGNISSTYIVGDLDPSSQLPFRLELTSTTRMLDTCNLIITYLDDFNTRYMRRYGLNVTYAEEPKIEEARVEHSMVMFYVLTVLATILFLVGVFIVIYKYLTSRLRTGVKI